MAALPETYNETVDTAQDAARVAAESGEDDPGPGYRLVEPRPDVIKWKHREISVPDTYDADTWSLFDTGGGQDLIAALVVPLSDEETEVIRFYIGAC